MGASPCCHNVAEFNECVVSRWFSFRVELIGGFVLFSVLSLALFTTYIYPLGITPSAIGLCVSYALMIQTTLCELLQSASDNEKNMISVERVEQFSQQPIREDLREGLGAEVDSSWPRTGRVEFNHVTLCYRADMSPALKDLNLRIADGEHVGICGRTGAGKTSLFSALFNLHPLTEGSIVLDGVDIARVPLRRARSVVSIIPQDPFLFCASVRDNLTLSELAHSDSQLWAALERAKIHTAVSRIGGLDAQVQERGGNFSTGEKQLLCLARALLTNNPILCLDEATANVDLETDQKIQETIQHEFQHCTVITVAHRVNTIMHCDRIVVLEEGTIVEVGAPVQLSQDPNSKFAQFIK